MITERKRGDTWKFVAWIADDLGNPITDFTDWEIWLTIKRQPTDEDEDAAAQVTLAAGGIVIADAGTGKVLATVTDTQDVSLGNYVVDWQFKDDSGSIQSSSTQTIKVVADITRAV